MHRQMTAADVESVQARLRNADNRSFQSETVLISTRRSPWGAIIAAVALVAVVLPLPRAHAGNSPNGDAAVAWPGSFSEYTMADGSSITDAEDNSPAFSDIWAGSGGTLPSTYFDSDGSNVFVRVRVRGNPEKRGTLDSTVYLVSIAVAGTQAAVIGLNGKPAAVDYVYAGNADGSIIREVYTTPFTNDGAGTSAGARWAVAPDEGYFVDFQVPISAITAVAPSVTPETPIQLFFGTSQAANLSVINKDYMIGSDVSYVGLSTVTLSGAPAGSAPTAVDDVATVVEDDSVVVDVAANDTDGDGDLDPSSTVIESDPINGAAVSNGDGTITYTPAAGYSGPDSFTYRICDTGGLCDTATVSVTVEPANQPPTASPDSAVVGEDGSVVIDAAANDGDVDGNLDPAGAAVSVPPANGTATANGDGTFTYTPDPNFNGADSFAYTICDTGGLCDTATVSVAVDAVPDAPVALPDSAVVSEDGSVVVDAAANDDDVDGNLDPAGAAVTVPPANGTATANGDGTFTYTPDPDFNGADSFAYTICDIGGLCDAATVSLTVDPVNDAPVAVDDVFSVAEDSAATIGVAANDLDADGDALTITGYDAVSAAGGTVSCASADCTYTPAADYSGPDSFTYTVDDGNGGTDTATVTLTVVGVNDPPGIVDDPVSTDEDTVLVVAVLANDSDPEGDTPAVDFFTQPPNGTVTDNGDGTLTYTPDVDFNGTDAFTYRACDDGVPSLCDEATVTVTVTPLNDPPVAGVDAVATDEDVVVVFNVLGNDFDAEGDALTIAAFDAVSVAGGTVACAPGGACTYDPPPLYSGPDSFTYTVADGNGGTDTTTVAIEVGPVNNRPVAGDDAAGATEDTPATLPGASLLGNDSDPDIDPLTITAVTDGAHGTAVVVGSDIVYTPAPDFNGPDTITYTVCDPGGLCDTAAIDLTVAAVNDDPIAKDDTATTDEDVPVTVAVLANDSDVDGDTLSVTSIVTNPVNGSAVVNGDNTITYTPASDFFGLDDFEYQVADGNGGVATAWVRFVTVNPVNDAPAANPDSATLDEDTFVTIDLLANDSDVDDATLTIIALTDPGAGSVADNGDRTVTYTPDPDFSGADSFVYTVCDPGGLCATETVSVTVDPVNDPPILLDDAAVTAEDTPATFNVIANDSDPDGDALVVVAVTGGANGSVVFTGDGTVTYTPDPDSSGSDTFTYTVSDGTVTATGSVTVEVVAVNDAPVAVDDVATIAEDGTLTIDVVGNDTDVDGDDVIVIGTSPGAHGTAVLEADGTVTYTPEADFFGTDTFTYTATDGNATVMGSVVVTVDPVNDAPVVVADSATGSEDSPVTVDVVANDVDVEDDPLAVVAVAGGAHGSATINGDGSVTYTPEADFFGTDTFTYTVSDGLAAVTGSVTVTISEVNDPPTAPGILAVGAGPDGPPPPLPIADADGDPLTATVVGGALPAGLTLNPDGTWSGTPTEQGTFEVLIEICDPGGACTIMVLSLTIALLPATGLDTSWLARLGTFLVLLGWWAVRWSNRRLVTLPHPGSR